jgi:hypothetical protein
VKVKKNRYATQTMKKAESTIHKSFTDIPNPTVEATPPGRLLLLLDYQHQLERNFRSPLCHDGGKLLTWILQRHRIPRERWLHTYVSLGDKKDLPGRKKEREQALVGDVDQGCVAGCGPSGLKCICRRHADSAINVNEEGFGGVLFKGTLRIAHWRCCPHSISSKFELFTNSPTAKKTP